MVQHKVQRVQVGQLISFHIAAANSREMLLHALGRYFADQNRIILRLESDEPDIGVIALVARSRMRDLPKLYPHPVLPCNGVEQAFMPAVRIKKYPTLAAAVKPSGKSPFFPSSAA